MQEPGTKENVSPGQQACRKSKIDPFKSSETLMTEINEEYRLNVFSRLVGIRLHESKIYGRVSRKNPHLSKKDIKARLSFANAFKSKDV